MPDAKETSLWPGLIRVVLITALAFLGAAYLSAYGIGATALGVLLGVLVGNTLGVTAVQAPGVRFAGRRLLTLAVVLLGFQVSFGDMIGLGWRIIAIVIGVTFGALGVSVLLGRLVGVDSRLAALIGTGTGICGASAIAAVRPAIGARDEDVTYAVAAITFLGSVGLVAYPVLQLALHPFSSVDFGVWSGATLHSVPQAVGAAFAGGQDAAGEAATVTKLARVALLGPLALLLAYAFRHRSARGPGQGWVPLEVSGFIVAAAVATTGLVPSVVLDVIASIDKVLLVMALTALGLQTRFGELRRTGTAPLAVALATWGIVLVAVFLVLHLG